MKTASSFATLIFFIILAIGGGLAYATYSPTAHTASICIGITAVKTSDGAIGHVEDFLIDDQTWAIRYLIIDTQNWLPGKRVLISPQWIETVSWSESSVFVNVPRDIIKKSPEYYNELSLTREYETLLHRHYNRQGYWVDEPAAGLVLV